MTIPFVDPSTIDRDHFGLVVVGSGFGSLFYLHKWLERNPDGRALVLERGGHHDHAWQIEHGRNAPVAPGQTYRSPDAKPWNFTIGLGGGTNCWFAQAPRFQPSDFRLRSDHGIGTDWPVGYDELEPSYAEAEAIMSIAGDDAMGQVLPRSTPFPQPPHRFSAVDQIMAAARPDRHFAVPTARARIAAPGRGPCCASMRCRLCPVDAKFTALNGLSHLLTDPRVSVAVDCRVTRLDVGAGIVRRAEFVHGGRERAVSGELFALGANAIHSPVILLASGIEGGPVGRYLHESYGAAAEAFLDGVDNFGGSTITTGINYALSDGPARARRGAALVFFENRWRHGLRTEPGRWRQTAPLTIVTETLPQPEDRVTLGRDGEPVVLLEGDNAYAERGMMAALDALPELLAPLPVEAIHFRGARPTESHLQGTLRMGDDPETSVVDRNLLHHRVRNLAVVGSAVFPSCGTANPSLTVAALSLHAAARAMGAMA